MQTYEFGNPEARIVLIEPIHTVEGMEHEADLIRELAGPDFFLQAVRVDWFRDLSPWDAPAVFRDIPFGHGAQKTLDEILKLTGEPGKRYIIGGYSLAGLFSLWAGCQTDAFAGVAAASPSVWYPGFGQYMECHSPKARHVYLSLGDREEKTRNPVMATVGDRIRELHEHFRRQGIPCCLEWNEGNHFKDPDLRSAKGFAWLLNNAK